MKFTNEMWRHYQTQGMPPVIQGVSLKGQVVVVTGANVGLGLEAAKHFAVRGPERLILVCRSEEKGRSAVERVKTETGFDKVELWISDLSSFESVRSIKDKIDNLERLDILVENAGVAMANYVETGDGWETTLQVNVLSTALRTILHLPKLIETAKKHPETVPRVVYVSCSQHYQVTIPEEVINATNTLKVINEGRKDDGVNWATKYGESKLLAQAFMRALQTRLAAVTCLSVGPGLCNTELTRHATGETAERARKVKEEFAYTAEEGGRQLLYAAVGERDKEDQVRGAWVAFSEISECSDFLLGDEGKRLEAKIWKEVLEIVASVDGTAKEIITAHLSQS